MTDGPGDMIDHLPLTPMASDLEGSWHAQRTCREMPSLPRWESELTFRAAMFPLAIRPTTTVAYRFNPACCSSQRSSYVS